MSAALQPIQTRPYWPRGKAKNPARVCQELSKSLASLGFPKITAAKLESTLWLRSGLSSSRPETFARKLAAMAERLHAPKPKLLRAALANPSLFTVGAAKVEQYLTAHAALLGLTKEHYTRIALCAPRLMTYTPAALERRVARMADALSLTEAQLSALVARRPNLLLAKPETLKARMGDTLSGQNPTLLARKPETLRSNIKRMAVLLDVAEDRLEAACRKRPTLMCRAPDTVARDAKLMAESLGLSLNDFLDIALRQPAILTLKPTTIAAKFALLTELAELNGGTPSAIAIIRQLPAALCYSSERISLCSKLVAVSPGRAAVACLLTYPRARMEGLIALKIKNGA